MFQGRVDFSNVKQEERTRLLVVDLQKVYTKENRVKSIISW